MKPVEPILAAPLFAPLHRELVALLRGLSPEEWERPTAAPLWRVRDVAAHLLDGYLRTLSFRRDGVIPPPDGPIGSYAELVAFLDRLNAQWVAAARRLSPAVLVELLEDAGPRVAEVLGGLDPWGPALFSVAWAGEDESRMWFDVAREYTEQWHHQAQIRDATGRPPLGGRAWLHPVLDAFVRALPHAYRDTAADDGTAVHLRIDGEAGDDWTLRREGGAWRLYAGTDGGGAESATARIALEADLAWRMFTKGITGEAARARARVEGDERLAAPFFGTLSVMG